MPRFRYTATNEKGKTVRGLLEAPSEEALYAKLRNDGLYMTDAQEAQKAHATFRPLKTAVLADFCRNLGTLLTAGVPLVRAFRIMADERTIDARQKALYEAILSELRKGVPLSDAMESCAPAFPTLLLAMIRSAEGTGSIDHACARMATYYEREHKMNQQVGNSMMYPIILSVLIVGVIAILMTFVLPQFKPMFDQMETLPFLTQLLFDVSDFVGANWPVLLVVAALIVFGGKLLLAQPKVRRQWDRFILHAPVVGVLNRKICTARFASTLSNLYGSGVPIITTLAAARDAIGNRWIESQFGDALDSIRAGHSLSEAIAGIDGFEVKLSSSVAVGEETGKLDSLLATISETLDYEAEMATKRLVTLLEPVMIVVMGLVVGGVVAAVICPSTSPTAPSARRAARFKGTTVNPEKGFSRQLLSLRPFGPPPSQREASSLAPSARGLPPQRVGERASSLQLLFLFIFYPFGGPPWHFLPLYICAAARCMPPSARPRAAGRALLPPPRPSCPRAA